MAASQIRRFLILHKELDADDGELTRTRKVRRGFIAERYEALIDALYGGAKDVPHRGRGHLRGRPQGHDRGRSSRSATCAPHPRDRRVGAALQEGELTPRWPTRARAINEVLLVGREHQPVVRRREGADRHQLRHPQGRDPRHHRPQRRRQDVDAELHQRLLSPAAGRDHLQGRDAQPHAAARGGRAGHRPHLPEHRAVQGHERRSTTS